MSDFTTVIPPDGIVDLSKDKQIPICERSTPFDLDYAFTRATVDISEFKRKLINLSPDIWEDEKQNEGNVKLTRPAHDAWGIKKIVFTFCDDFLLKVFDLPWSQSEEWRAHLLPIYHAMGIDESRVVRCLLASMPPGMSIPVHHDTGYWVKHTHRCHVAIVSGSEVDFFVGPTNETLRRVKFDEGRVVELNNQAKHAVTNGMKDTWRIHLIFDYVDTHPINRYVLQPGEKLNQTRRSIDLARHEGTRQVPSFVIIGAQKSGTTSLYELLCEHPLVIRGKRRETHFFDWRWLDPLDAAVGAAAATGSTAPVAQEEYQKYFNADALFKYPSLLTGESTPSYLLHSDFVIPRLKAVCPWAKLLVVLRNPVDRAFSQYQMCTDPEGTPEQLKVRGMSAYAGRSFEDIVEEEIAELERMGINADCSYELFRSRLLQSRAAMKHGGHSIVARGLYAMQLQPWLEQFADSGRSEPQIMVLTIGQLKDSRSTSNDSSSNGISVSISSSSNSSSSCSSSNSSSNISSGHISSTNRNAGTVQDTMNAVFRFVGIPPHDLANVQARNARAYSTMSVPTRARLETFYAPYNRRLLALLTKYPSTQLQGPDKAALDW